MAGRCPALARGPTATGSRLGGDFRARLRDATAVAPRSTVLKNSDPAEDDDVWLVPCYFVRVRAPSIGFPPALLTAVVELAEE